MKMHTDANTAIDHYVYRDIKFSISHELLKDVWDMCGIDVVEEVKHGIYINLKVTFMFTLFCSIINFI